MTNHEFTKRAFQTTAKNNLSYHFVEKFNTEIKNISLIEKTVEKINISDVKDAPRCWTNPKTSAIKILEYLLLKYLVPPNRTGNPVIKQIER